MEGAAENLGPDGRVDFFHELADLLFIACGEDDCDFIASVTAHDVASARLFLDPLRKLQESFVAGRVSVGVVDASEMIDVDEDQADWVILVLGLLPGFFEFLLESTAVQGLGEGIVHGGLPELFEETVAFGLDGFEGGVVWGANGGTVFFIGCGFRVGAGQGEGQAQKQSGGAMVVGQKNPGDSEPAGSEFGMIEGFVGNHRLLCFDGLFFAFQQVTGEGLGEKVVVFRTDGLGGRDAEEGGAGGIPEDDAFGGQIFDVDGREGCLMRFVPAGRRGGTVRMLPFHGI